MGRPSWFPGHAHGLRQPVLQVRLRCRVSDPLPWSALQAWWRAAWPQLASAANAQGNAADETATPAGGDVLAGPQLLARWAEDLLHLGGLPVLERARWVPLNETEGRLLLPALEQQAAMLALNLILKFVSAADAAAPGPALAESLRSALRAFAAYVPAGQNTPLFLQAAHELDIPCERLAGNAYQFGHGARSRWLRSSFTDQTPSISTWLARNKQATAELLRNAGLPVPDHFPVRNVDEALAAADRLGYPVVVKPAALDGGRGVAAGLRTPQALRRAYEAARQLAEAILVERHVEGSDHRVQVMHGEAYWVVKRVPGSVTGDGRLRVAELVRQANAGRGEHYSGIQRLLRPLQLDEEAAELLAEQGLSADAVPEAERFVRLRRAANVASGGVPVVYELDQVHPDNLRLAERAARVLRLDLAGVDLLIPDIQRSWLETGAAICEVNAQPHLYPHLPRLILQRLLGPQRGRIPVLLVLGVPRDAPESQLAERLHRGLLAQGVQAGLAGPQGVWVGRDRVAAAGSGCYAGGRMLRRDTAVQAVVLDVPDMQVLRTGWPFDRCDLLLLAGPLVLAEPRQADGRQQPLAIGPMLRRVLIDLRPRAVIADADDDDTVQTLRQAMDGQAELLAVRPTAPDARDTELAAAALRWLQTNGS
ncbi:acetate--CoA ligase family protein [Aquabacterium sp.]|uniref:ATP-binding protein n=1 Tax=Aquabacterium sp. TaxID=1872578 RepID=UPI002BE953BC|nr:acetate--CoA ligase family protein [Aquabacterium sp.]HSW08091.1 acetate--CoA ligase family protein [Aquabacterium sp.]